MLTLARRVHARFTKLRAVRRPESRRRFADRFLGHEVGDLVGGPGDLFWFHTMPLPDGRRIRGVNIDPNREQKLWESCFGTDRDCLRGKRVLDVGANDGFFTIASLLCGARSCRAVNTGDLVHGSFPTNLRWASRAWGVSPRITVGDFLDLSAAGPKYDVILFFGVLYHLENVFLGLRVLDKLLAPGGRIYVETQVTKVESDSPVLEVASDSFRTTVPQIRGTLDSIGNSNFLIPNPPAVQALAETFGYRSESLPAGNPYETSFGGLGGRRIFVLQRATERPTPKKG